MTKTKTVASILFALALTACASGCEEVPKPRIKEGRFNFSVTYAVHGEEETISGVYVCKFVKATSSINGWWREWKTYIEGSDMKEEVEILTNEDGVIYLDLGLDAFYFMSDPFYDEEFPQPELSIYYNEKIREETGEFWSFEPEVLESYGVTHISYEYDPPIENVYE